MVFVNCLDVSGPGWDWMHHTAWDGLHLADFVWPIFLYVMGACMACAYDNLQGRRARRLAKTARRGLLLFVIGMFIKNNHGLAQGIDLANLRIMSVLGRIGFAYMMTATALVLAPPRSRPRSRVPEVTELVGLLVIAAAVGFVYLMIVFLLPVPDCELRVPRRPL